MNESRGDGDVVQFEIVPFNDGSDPTQPPHNLPPLHSFNVIETLHGAQLVAYLNGYGVVLHPLATNDLRKEVLKGLIGGSP